MKKISWGETFSKLYFLLLLPLFFVLHGYVENYPVVPLVDSLLLLLKYIVAALVLTGFFFLFIRSWRSAAVLAFIIMAFQIFFGAVHDSLKDIFPNSFIIKYIFILPVSLLGFIFLLIYFKKKKPVFITFSKYINVLLIVFILIDVVQLLFLITKAENKSYLASSFRQCNNCVKPDIYLIIADGYSGKIPLQEVLNFDNSAFENELKTRGFHIVDSSISNYNYTPFTMASMLGIQYLKSIEGRNTSLSDRNICFTHINDNPVLHFLDNHGYSFVNNSIFYFAGKVPHKSTTFYKTGIDLVRANTFLARVDRDIRFNLVTKFKIQSEIERVNYYTFHLNKTLFEKTWTEAKTPSEKPRFIYTHLQIPHYPYYFNKDGKPNNLKEILEESQTDTRLYLEYLQYGNKKFLELIDHIFANAKQPPVILLMSDHAFREYSSDTVDRKYHFMNFNAVYLPNKNYNGFYKGMSTVNQFPVLFNAQFNQQLPLLKDSTTYIVE